MKREIIKEEVGGIGAHELEGTIDEVIRRLEKIRNRHSGMVSCRIEENYSHDEEYDQNLFHIVIKREETAEEQKARLEEIEASDKLEKEQRWGQYKLLKEEFDGE